MKKEHILLLEKEAAIVADTYSNRTKDIGKHTGITFRLEHIRPLSDETATVTYVKSTGIRAIAFFYLLQYKKGDKWNYFFPTDSHIAGMNEFGHAKAALELVNYSTRKISGDLGWNKTNQYIR